MMWLSRLEARTAALEMNFVRSSSASSTVGCSLLGGLLFNCECMVGGEGALVVLESSPEKRGMGMLAKARGAEKRETAELNAL
jgi:hypothetical protein